MFHLGLYNSKNFSFCMNTLNFSSWRSNAPSQGPPIRHLIRHPVRDPVRDPEMKPDQVKVELVPVHFLKFQLLFEVSGLNG